MSPEKQSQIAELFPEFFAPAEGSASNRPIITCGDGWFDVLVDLFSALRPLLEGTKHLSNPPRLGEVSKRNDRLRVLLRPLTPEMSWAIYQAEARSESVCETCGAMKEANGLALCATCESIVQRP